MPAPETPLPDEDEPRHKIRFLYSVFLLAGIVASVMGFFRWQSSPLMGAIDFIFAGLSFILLFTLSRHPKQVESISTLALALSFILFFAIYVLAVNNVMRLSLFFLLSASGFFLKGRKIGRLWLAGIIFSIVAAHVSGLFSTGYSNLDIATTCVYLFALFFVFENYESFKEKERQRQHSEAEALRAKHAAESANLAKSQFLATMSHEIRTPLNGVLGMAQLLLMQELSETERHEYAKTILNSGETLLTLLNDILDFSKVEAGKIELFDAPCAPRQVLADNQTLFAELAKAKGLTLTSIWNGPDDYYALDPSRLRQMLSNLLSNAIKFTGQGFVRLQAFEAERMGNMATLEFSVTDSGIGIPEDKRPLLFLPFSQADSSTTREYGGTGLGLSIVRSLAEMMGGGAGVESEPGKGSRFWFRIKAEVLPEKDLPVGPTIAHAGTAFDGMVLIVDDNATNRKVLEALLKKLNIQTMSVGNGQEAVDTIQGGLQADLILMDVQMPVMNGLLATERIRQWENETGQKKRHIIALTASAFEEDRQNCFAAGMNDFLTKPVNLNSLKSTLATWMGKPQC